MRTPPLARRRSCFVGQLGDWGRLPIVYQIGSRVRSQMRRGTKRRDPAWSEARSRELCSPATCSGRAPAAGAARGLAAVGGFAKQQPRHDGYRWPPSLPHPARARHVTAHRSHSGRLADGADTAALTSVLAQECDFSVRPTGHRLERRRADGGICGPAGGGPGDPDRLRSAGPVRASRPFRASLLKRSALPAGRSRSRRAQDMSIGGEDARIDSQ